MHSAKMSLPLTSNYGKPSGTNTPANSPTGNGARRSIADRRVGKVRYSLLALVSQALRGNTGWKPVWRDADLKPAYDVIIVGGGGHGLATAFYLAKEHGITNVAVLEKSWLGSGNVGRNTTIIRSNYLLPGNIPFYEWSMKLWERLE